MIILGGSSGNGIDESVAKLLGVRHVKLETTKFPDGEMKVRIPERFDDDTAVIIQSAPYPQERNLFELMFIADDIRERVGNIIAVIPYMAYARQDKSFTQGEAISVNTVLKLLRNSGVGALVVVNPHKSEPLAKFGGTVEIINAVGTLTKKVKESVEKPLIMSPDISGVPMAKAAAEALGCEFTYIEKKRESSTQTTITQTHGGDFNGKDVVIFDDMISTGSTVEPAATFAYAQGARSVSAAAIHLVMVNGALERMRKAGVKRLFGTNTIAFKDAELADISGDVAECISRLTKYKEMKLSTFS